MDKRALTERDICTKFILPAVRNAGWAVLQCLAEEALRGFEVALGGEQKIDRLAVLVDGPVQITLLAPDADVSQTADSRSGGEPRD